MRSAPPIYQRASVEAHDLRAVRQDPQRFSDLFVQVQRQI